MGRTRNWVSRNFLGVLMSGWGLIALVAWGVFFR